jgi:hypothetical protein
MTDQQYRARQLFAGFTVHVSNCKLAVPNPH